MIEANMEEARKESPCRECTRVRDPANCENKLCKDWQAWFIDRWEAMRRDVFAQMRQAKATGDTVSVGGFQYSHPDRVRENNDPCQSCYCPKDVCTVPCQVKLAWEKVHAKGEEK